MNKDIFKTNFTDSQYEAITRKGENILVSAGAGSGKTTVLTKRIINHLTNNNVSLNNLIVLTFTNNAAFNMKEKIKKELQKNPLLKNELRYLDSSNIKTFDSYALSLVKKYHYLLNIDKDIKIIDSNILEIKRKEVIENLYIPEKLLNDYTTRDSDYLLDILFNLSKTYDEIPYSIDFNSFYNNVNLNKYYSLIFSRIKECENLLNSINTTCPIFEDYIFSLKQGLSIFSYQDKDPSILIGKKIEYPKVPAKADKSEKEKFNSIIVKYKKEMKEIVRLLDFNSEEELIENYFKTKENALLFEKCIKEIESKMSIYKSKYNFYTYQDISKKAIELLVNNPSIRNEIKDKTYEILVDEYQDTSDIQDYFISLIANNNVYMVGDVKQSIYRFRGANPNNFLNKNCYKIFMKENFRSRKECLDDINEIFSPLMENIDYDNSHKAILGNPNYTQNELYKSDYIIVDSKEVADEAMNIAQDILEKNNSFMLKDRKATLNDFVILVKTKKNIKIYKDIFKEMNIPLKIIANDPFLESDEIIVIKSIIGLILDFNISEYISVLRSFLYEISDEEILNIINDFKSHNLYSLIYSINKKSNNINELVYNILLDFSFFEKISKLYNPELLEKKLFFLLEKAKEFDSYGFSYKDFYNYLDNSILKDIEFQNNMINANEAVTLMTIHASKGLEFNIVYLPEIFRKFSILELNTKFLLKKDYFSIPYFEDVLKETFIKDLIKLDTQNEDIEEQIRLFYVALTRVKEKIVFIGPHLERKPGVSKRNLNSFLNFLESTSFSPNFIYKNPDLKENKKLEFKKNINEKYEEIIFKRLSPINDFEVNNTNELFTIKDKENIDKGIMFHKELEFNLPSRFNESFHNTPLFKEKILNIYHEYEYVHDSKTGIIDLILEFESNISIIDFKLKEIDKKEYTEQLAKYKNFLKTITTKNIKTYLYSILDNQLLEINL